MPASDAVDVQALELEPATTGAADDVGVDHCRISKIKKHGFSSRFSKNHQVMKVTRKLKTVFQSVLNLHFSTRYHFKTLTTQKH